MSSKIGREAADETPPHHLPALHIGGARPAVHGEHHARHADAVSRPIQQPQAPRPNPTPSPKRPLVAALTLDELLASARTHNPTLQAAQAAIAENAGRAKQAGLWPNLVLGYEGDQIRGGSYGGGEQGAFLQQTIPLGGKLGRRRDIYQRTAAHQ